MPQEVKLEEWALTLAAQCWCTEKTKCIEMDSRLAEEFARVLMQQRDAYREGQAIDAGG